MEYVFEPERLHECVRQGIGLPVGEAMDRITEALSQAYPRRIQTGERRWHMNNAGGAMGQMTLLYASMREYIIFFGTPIGTEGHSGRYRSVVYDFIFDGEVWCYGLGDTDRQVYGPGDVTVLERGEVKGYRIPDHAWMLEYARGNIPSMLPFGVMDTMTSTLDVRTLFGTFGSYYKEVMRARRG